MTVFLSTDGRPYCDARCAQKDGAPKGEQVPGRRVSRQSCAYCGKSLTPRVGNPQNRPRKGDRITVDPIRRLKDVKAIAKLTAGNPRNHLLFLMGVNNGLRAGDLLKLKVKAVRHMKAGDRLTIRESKTHKENILVVNKTVYKALKNYLEKLRPDDDAYLFASRKGNKAITIQAVNNLIKKWTQEINLKGNYGAHSLRKTWGYIQRTVNGVGFEIICKRFQHSSPAVTMRYLGIQDREVHNTLMNEIG